MKTARILRVVAAAAVLTLAVGTVALAADPSPTVQPIIGGSIDAYANRDIVVTNGGNVPALVNMTADKVTLSEQQFRLPPGESYRLHYTGDPVGTVTAKFTVDAPTVAGGDSGSATLVLSLKPYTPPFDWLPVLWAVVFVIAIGFLLRRYKPWRWRIVTHPA